MQLNGVPGDLLATDKIKGPDSENLELLPGVQSGRRIHQARRREPGSAEHFRAGGICLQRHYEGDRVDQAMLDSQFDH